MMETAGRMDTGSPDVASPASDALDDRSMRLLEWALSGVALLVAIALALLR